MWFAGEVSVETEILNVGRIRGSRVGCLSLSLGFKDIVCRGRGGSEEDTLLFVVSVELVEI